MHRTLYDSNHDFKRKQRPMKNHLTINRSSWIPVIIALAVVACCTVASRAADKKIVVGFSQIGAESGWRTANTESIKSEAARRGVDLKFADAQQKQENQIKALRSFIAQG